MYTKLRKLFDIKVIYTIVFLTLASWSFFAYFTMTKLIEEQKIYAKIINLSGKQRMLSQKTTLIAKRYFETNNKNLKSHFLELIKKMEEDHNYIINNLTSKRTENLYFEKPYKLDEKVREYLSILRTFYKTKDLKTLEKIEFYSFSLLPKLNSAVDVFENESETMTRDLLQRERFILLGTLITLLLEAIFIVIPSIKLVDKKQKELKDLNNQLEKRVHKAINDNQKKEDMLKQQFRLVQMGEMITNIAHHWRQPLSIISSIASAMKVQKELKVLEDKNLIINLDKIVERTKHLSNIIDDFSTFTQSNDDLLFFNITTSLDSILNLLSASLKYENINLIKDFDSEEIHIEGNIIKFRQIILNILNNAKDVLKESDEKYKYIKVTLKNHKDSVEVSIQNNGKKLDDNIKDKIFDIYFTTKHKNQGTGLGLFICHEIVTKYFKGQILAKNLPNKGVSFNLTFPKRHS